MFFSFGFGIEGARAGHVGAEEEKKSRGVCWLVNKYHGTAGRECGLVKERKREWEWEWSFIINNEMIPTTNGVLSF